MTRELIVMCPVCDRQWVLTCEEEQEVSVDFMMVCSPCTKDSEESGSIKSNGTLKVDGNSRIYSPNQMDLL